MVNWNKHSQPAIYALHAGDNVYRYVGSTSINIIARMYSHRYRARKGHGAPVYQWMRSVGIDNVVCEVIAFENDAEFREDLEVATIAQLKGSGFPLVNKIWIVGDGLNTASKEYRRIVNGSPLASDPRQPKLRIVPPKPEKKKRGERQPAHGTRTEYEKYGCRCDACRLVTAQRNARRRGKPIPLTAPPRKAPQVAA